MNVNRLWVVRPDRLGDVLLSLPVIQGLKARFPHLQITAFVSPAVAPVLSGHPDLRGVEIIPPEGQMAFFRECRARLQPDAVLVLQNKTSTSAALRCSGAPHLFGPLGKLGARLWFHQGVPQHRSRVEKSEAEYGLELAGAAWKLWTGESAELEKVSASVLAPRISVSPDDDLSGVSPVSAVVIHPGMGGSALNWTIEKYSQLIGRLVDAGESIVVSIGPQDQRIGQTLWQTWSESPSVRFWGLEHSPTLKQTAALMRRARVVVAPSTGPLHLAAAVGTTVVGIYPPIRVQSAKRWGPIGWTPEKSKVVSPEVDCPAVFRCLGAECAYFDCMDGMEIDRVVKLILATKGYHP